MGILYMVLGWFAGLWLGGELILPLDIWLLAATGAALLGLLRRRARGGWAAAALACLLLGAARMGAAAPVIDAGHVAFYNDGGAVRIEGRVAAAPEIGDRERRLRLAAARLVEPDGAAREVSGLVLVTIPRYVNAKYGDRLALDGVLETPAASDDFDYRAYLARRGIFSVMRRAAVTPLPADGERVWRRPIFAVRRRAMAVIDRLLPEPAGSLLTGILIGDDNGLPQDLADDFRVTGMTHIIAISGFNIAILIGVLVRMGDPLLGRRGGIWFALLGIGAYTILVGAEAAVVRAAIMGALYLLSTRILGRKTVPLASLFVAGALMTAANPHALWDVGFQLSFGATLSLMLYAAPLSDAVRRRLAARLSRRRVEQVMGLLSDAVLVTVAAQILTLPLLVYYFEQVSLVSLLANALILPAQPAVMTWGGAATLVGLVAPALARPAAGVAWLFLSYTIGLVRLLAQVPLASVPLRLGLPGLIGTYAVLGTLTFLARAENRLSLRRLAAPSALRRLGAIVRPQAVAGVSLLAAALVLLWGRSQPDGLLHVVFLDVGQGDAIFIQTPGGRQILIDGGLEPSRLNDRLGRQMPFWDRTLDVVVATHADADHIGGLADLFAQYEVEWLVTDGEPAGVNPLFDALIAEAGAHHTQVQRAIAGDAIVVGDDVRLDVLHPGAVRDPDDRNDNSVSLRLVYGDFSLLLTGDAEAAAERAMVAGGSPLDAQVFKAGHHGSRTSSNAFFLAAVRPQVIVISAGADNSYGHPHAEVLARATEVGAAVLRTDELGSIVVTTDGTRMWWQARP